MDVLKRVLILAGILLGVLAALGVGVIHLGGAAEAGLGTACVGAGVLL